LISVQFLRTANQLKDETEVDNLLAINYKSILERRNSDGSFSFKGYGRHKSIWLTSLVAKCLGQRGNLSVAEESHLKSALDFLKKHQLPSNSVGTDEKDLSGSFVDFGDEKKLEISLTAFVLTAFLENPNYAKTYKDTVEKALDFIDRHIVLLINNYEISLCAYVFTLAEHGSAKYLVQHLKHHAIVENDKKHWNVNEDKKVANLLEEIELACYAFLAFHQV
jgi:A-macroglobulin TED domain